jgi:hypothetical protein
MNTPSGLVIARIRARNTAICIQPLIVISEILRFQQGVEQVEHQTGAYNQHDDGFSAHIVYLIHLPQTTASTNSIAESDVCERQDEKRYRDHD